MLALLVAQQTPGSPAGNAIIALFGAFWCGFALLALAHFVCVIVAIIQVLTRKAAADQKLLWCLVIWFVPLIGPILWWVIGSKQVGNRPGPPDLPY